MSVVSFSFAIIETARFGVEKSRVRDRHHCHSHHHWAVITCKRERDTAALPCHQRLKQIICVHGNLGDPRGKSEEERGSGIFVGDETRVRILVISPTKLLSKLEKTQQAFSWLSCPILLGVAASSCITTSSRVNFNYLPDVQERAYFFNRFTVRRGLVILAH